MKLLFILIFTLLFPFQAISKDAVDEEIIINNQEQIDKYLNGIKNIPQARFKKYATLQILDKTTAKSLDKTLALKEKFLYGNIQITVHKCWQAPLTQKPDSKILIEVNEINPKDKYSVENIFLGWIIASSPSISGLEHPIYDITALDCKDQ